MTSTERVKQHQKRRKLGVKQYNLWLPPELARNLIPVISIYKTDDKQLKEWLKQEKKKLK